MTAIRDLPKEHEVWAALHDAVVLICMFRLEKNYAEADWVRDAVRSIFGLEVRTENRHVYIGDRIGPLAWTHDA